MNSTSPTNMTGRWWTLALIMLVAVSVRLLFLQGFAGSDDLHYAEYAREFVAGTWKYGSYFHEFRLGVILPTAAGYALFGINTATTIWWPMLCSLVGVLVVFQLGRELFGASAGLWAALVYAVLPVDVVQAGLLMPDVPVATLTGLALCLVLYGERSERRGWSVTAFAAAGLVLGLGYLCKVTGLLPVPILLLYGILRRRRLPLYGVMLATLAVVCVAEGLTCQVMTGDFFHRAHVVANWPHAIADGSLASQLASLWEYPRAMFLSVEEFGPFWYLVALSVVWSLVTRLKRAWVVLLWVVPLWLYLQFGISSFRQLVFPVHVPRYLTLVTIPATALIGAFFARLHERRRWTLLCVLSAGTVLGSLFFAGLHATLVESKVWNMVQVARQLKELPRRPTYVLQGVRSLDWLIGPNPLDLRVLYRKRDTESGGISEPLPVEILAGSYVVVDRRLINFTRERHELKLPDYLETIPRDWKTAAEMRNDFSGVKYASVRLVRWMLGHNLIPGPIASRFRRTLSGVMQDHECVVYEVPAAVDS